ncbi:putative cleavage and polyadenylation specificity factor [Planoprotostelium fungivorum]|uniref:Putative cleavage and polyadenylation specificity factor n=1 Tax=Planoprotostelium fungivorum TaxID=1890364 RepID=A0A2P6NUD2_9EUKA|nr:putative cleavage and polyadenylation specificity factor [Planoprotostelium fungivorum]
MTIRVVPLGAGQDVGRSCVLVTVGHKNIMFDCGMHMGYNDDRRFPDFNYISKGSNFNQFIDAVIISHFDPTKIIHIEQYPTKAIAPILLEDYRKITVERKGETNFFTSQMIKDCMKKVIAVNIHQTVHVDADLEIKAYYGGHVLGAAMFYVKCGDESVVYTGDYNTTPDRHLGAAWIDKVRPDLLITETTYATTIRDSKRQRERDFLNRVHSCVEKGGKVLIPVFALGRAQELLILLDTYWERMNLNVPIYFSPGLTEKANLYYKLFINWTNQKIKKTFVKRNMFDFKHVKPFSREYADHAGGQVLLATPGMLHAGTSLEVFRKWAPNEMNMCILPGYCVVGTVGNKLLAGHKGMVEIDKRTKVEVKCAVESLSFSAHADAKGIMQLIRQAEPKNVLLVHGEKGKMQFLKQKIVQKFNIPCFDPANGATVVIPTSTSIPVDISVSLLKRQLEELEEYEESKKAKVNRSAPIHGVLVMKANQLEQDPIEAITDLGLHAQNLKFESNFIISERVSDSPETLLHSIYNDVSQSVQVLSVSVTIKGDSISVSWSYSDELLASAVLSFLEKYQK